MDDLKSALESIELGRQLVKRLNHTSPSVAFESAVANLNAALAHLRVSTKQVAYESLPSTVVNVNEAHPVTIPTPEEREPKKKKTTKKKG